MTIHSVTLVLLKIEVFIQAFLGMRPFTLCNERTVAHTCQYDTSEVYFIIPNMCCTSVLWCHSLRVTRRFAECHFAERHFAEWHFAECHFAECLFAECQFAYSLSFCRMSIRRMAAPIPFVSSYTRFGELTFGESSGHRNARFRFSTFVSQHINPLVAYVHDKLVDNLFHFLIFVFHYSIMCT